MENQPLKLDLQPINMENATSRQKLILEETIKKNGRLPNMYANMVNSPGLLETYLHGYEVFRRESGFSPVEQEVIFLTLSYENGCNYCMAAHSFIAEKVSKIPNEVIESIRKGEMIKDEKLLILSEFTKEMFTTRGRPSKESFEKFKTAGYDERKVLEIILALAVKTLSNYSNHVFDTKLDDIFLEKTLWAIN